MCAGRGTTDTLKCPSQFLCSPARMAPAFRSKGSHTRVRLSALVLSFFTGFPSQLSLWMCNGHCRGRTQLRRKEGGAGSHLPQWMSPPYPTGHRQWYLSSPSGTHVPPFWHGWESQGSKQDRGRERQRVSRESAPSHPVPVRASPLVEKGSNFCPAYCRV